MHDLKRNPAGTLRRGLRIALVLFSAFLFVGCAGLERPAVQKRHFDLRPERGEVQEAPGHAPVVRLRRVQVSPLFGGREMVVRNADAAFATDYYNTWFAPPADLVTQGLREWLRGSGVFRHVLEGASLAGAPLVLEGTLNALYGDYAGERAEAVVEMQFLLIDESTPHNDILFTGSYEARVPLASRSAHDLALGVRRAVADVFARLEAGLVDYGPSGGE